MAATNSLPVRPQLQRRFRLLRGRNDRLKAGLYVFVGIGLVARQGDTPAIQILSGDVRGRVHAWATSRTRMGAVFGGYSGQWSCASACLPKAPTKIAARKSRALVRFVMMIMVRLSSLGIAHEQWNSCATRDRSMLKQTP